MVELTYEEQKEYIAQLLSEISEFQASSRELETELEQELEESDKKQRDLQDQVTLLTEDVEQWKTKFIESQKESSAIHASLQNQISALKDAQKEATTKLREIEMENDDMERHGRITKTSLEEVEQKYYESLEQIALLEADLADKDDLKVELQRTKDELKETKEELTVANKKIGILEKSLVQKENKLPKKQASSTEVVTTFKASPPRFSRLSSSKSLRRVHGMINQMQTLQIRVDNLKTKKVRSPTSSRSPGSNTKERKKPIAPLDNANNLLNATTPSRQKSDLSTIEGSPTLMTSPGRQNHHQRSMSTFAQTQMILPPNRSPQKKSRSVSPQKINMNKPGQAFSALHSRSGTSIGHVT